MKVTVIMGIYNCAETLGAALNSLLAQTFTNWNLVMCDDGSSDMTYEIAEHYQLTCPEKFTLLRNEHNMGLNYTLNRCLSIADGEYIARQDGDDLSMPTRFEKEVAVLDAFPNISIVSTAMKYFDESGTWGQNHPIEFPQKEDFIAGTPFCHENELNLQLCVNIYHDMILQMKEALPKRAKSIALPSDASKN